MECPFCKATVTEGEYIDNGVGMQQISPHYCEECEVIQMGFYDKPRDEDEKRTGWRKGLQK
jgi:hypothetical protein